ncbi:MAG: acylneuraminate cytidylyltransferase family protein [Clostridiales bacterium]|jgi:CMP-N-acetylneuraminic acid synthetase|nr:acylneuraminate cytidylyltransferase family protein [Clostridiales bacterium]
MKTIAFIPIKLNNERLPGKNIKLLHNKPLISYILETALKVRSFDSVYVWCSNEGICDYLPQGVKLLKRAEYLDLSNTSITAVISEFVQAVPADVYALMHATAPYTSAESVEKGINAIVSGEYDCSFSVTKHNEFLWQDGKPNYDTRDIPRTQDLDPFFIETTGFYIFKRELITENGSRIGNKPMLVEVSKLEAIDINEQVDFELAQALPPPEL